MAERLMPGLERRLKAEIAGGVAFRPLHARPLRDRRLALPDHAARRGDAAHDRRGRAGDRARARGGRAACCRAAAARRRPGRRSTTRWSSTARSISTASSISTSPAAAAAVEPGIVLDDLNRALKPHGLWFPVDVSTASRATIGGMTAQQFLRRPLAALRQHARERALDRRAAGRRQQGAFRAGGGGPVRPAGRFAAASRWRATCSRSARARPTRSRRAFPRCSAGSAATTSTRWCRAATTSTSRTSWSARKARSAFSTAIELKLSPVLGRRAVGACHFGSFHEAMEAAQHIVKLAPIAVELVDRTMIELAREIAMFRPTLEAFVRGEPAALLLVEFARGRPGRERAPAARGCTS